MIERENTWASINILLFEVLNTFVFDGFPETLDELDAVVNPYFLINPVGMPLDRIDRYEQGLGDVLVAPARTDMTELKRKGTEKLKYRKISPSFSILCRTG